MKFSIVTASYNSAKYIRVAIESALAQRGDVEAFEHIVADAESDDDTSMVLADYQHLIVDRQKDGGIYDGMNRGIARVSGDVVVILNSDDSLAPGALATAARKFAETDAEVVSGGYRMMDGEGSLMPRSYHSRQVPTFESLLFGIPAINARFFRRELFEKVGPFDPSIGLAADRAWLVRARGLGVRFESVDTCFYVYRQHPQSATISGNQGARHRVHTSNIDMADALLKDWASMPTALIPELKAFKCLEQLKLSLLSLRDGSGRASDRDFRPTGQAANGLMTAIASPLALARGVLSWQRHRDRHADS